jgi:hypothetical protein
LVTSSLPPLGVSAEALSIRFPLLYHMAAQGSWPSIQRHGLLSTSALLDLFAVSGQARTRLESEHRSRSDSIKHPVHGVAIVRDQIPMSDAGLKRCLQDGLTPAAWYRLLNTKVFFWLTMERLERLLGARAYRDEVHTVLTIDTATLLARHAGRVLLSPINSGCTKPYPHPRGLATFQPLATYPFAAYDHSRSRKDPVVELAVEGGVADVRELVVRVEERRAGNAGTVIWAP